MSGEIIMLSKHEQEVMSIFWAHDGGLTHVQLLELSPSRSWKDSTIHNLINGLLDKGLIEEVGKIPSGRRHSRVFAPKITQEEFDLSQVTNIISNSKKLKLTALVHNFVQNSPISNDERSDLIKYLENLKE